MRVFLKDFFSTEKVAVEVTFDEPDSCKNLASVHQPQGVYCYLGSVCVGLFVAEGRLFLCLNGLASEVRGQWVTASFHSEGEIRRLRLTIGESVTTIVYSNPRLPVSTQFYSEDEEDSDFGLWLSNVLGSALRRDIFIQSWRVAS